MEWQIAFVLVTLALLLLLAFGQWIAMALGTAGLILIIIDGGIAQTSTIGSIAYNSVNSFVLTAIPLFLFMGEVILRAGLSDRFYRGVASWISGVPGGLLHSNIAASSLFSAISGSSVATAAAIGTVAIPEMQRRGYDQKLTLASIAGGGSVGMLIPPSIAALIYGALVEVSVAKLFIAGMLPGLLLSALFSIYIASRVLVNRSLAPEREERATWRVRLRGLWDATPLMGLMFVVLGAIYLGVGTPTEAAALGAVGALIVSAVFGELTWQGFLESVKRTLRTNAMLIFIIVGAQVASFALVNSGVTRNLVGWVVDLGLPKFAFFLMLILLYVLLGTVVDGLSLMLLTLPILYPVIVEIGFDPILFGVLLIVFIELGQITPPVGLDLFVYHGIAPDIPMNEIVRAALPIALIIVAVTILLYFYPQIALWPTTFV